jgi:hypothetical protein
MDRGPMLSTIGKPKGNVSGHLSVPLKEKRRICARHGRHGQSSGECAQVALSGEDRGRLEPTMITVAKL